MKVSKEYTFHESDVTAWCADADDTNPLHLDEEAAQEHELFEERIVPGMMLLDRVSGLITQWGETKEGTPVLSRLSGVDFKNPVPLDTVVEISVEEEEVDEAEEMFVLRFEVIGEDSVYAHGFATVYVL